MPDDASRPAVIDGLDALLDALDAGETIRGDSAHHQAMHAASQEALRLTAELNGTYHRPEAVVELMSALTGRQVPDTFRMFPPFTTDFAATSASENGSSSTAAVASRIRAGSRSATTC